MLDSCRAAWVKSKRTRETARQKERGADDQREETRLAQETLDVAGQVHQKERKKKGSRKATRKGGEKTHREKEQPIFLFPKLKETEALLGANDMPRKRP